MPPPTSPTPPTPIEGWLNDVEADLLKACARQCHGDALEIGSYRGKSANVIVPEIGGDLYCCDPFISGFDNQVTGSRESIIAAFVDALCGGAYCFNVRVCAMTEEQLWKGWPPTKRLGLLYLDGDHDYAATLRAMNRWVPYCEGHVLLHDYGGMYLGVKQAVDEYCASHKRKIVRVVDRMVLLG